MALVAVPRGLSHHRDASPRRTSTFETETEMSKNSSLHVSDSVQFSARDGRLPRPATSVGRRMTIVTLCLVESEQPRDWIDGV